MTRGKLVFICDKGVFVSNEFNGDMYLEQSENGPTAQRSWGDEAWAALDRADTKEQFDEELKDFVENYYGEEAGDCDKARKAQGKVASKTKIRFDVDYFEHWFSDYVFVKNATAKRVKVCLKNGEETFIEPGKVGVFNFGRAEGPGITNTWAHQMGEDLDSFRRRTDPARNPPK